MLQYWIKGGFRLHQCKLGSWISFVDGVHNEPAPEGIHPNAIMMMVSVNIIYDNDHIDIMINVIVVLIVFIRLFKLLRLSIDALEDQ